MKRMTAQERLTWARNNFRWQITLSPTPYPLPARLKPTNVWLRLREALKGDRDMVPDVEAEKSYWFFESEADAKRFTNYVFARYSDVSMTKAFCPKTYSCVVHV